MTEATIILQDMDYEAGTPELGYSNLGILLINLLASAVGEEQGLLTCIVCQEEWLNINDPLSCAVAPRYFATATFAGGGKMSGFVCDECGRLERNTIVIKLTAQLGGLPARSLTLVGKAGSA